MKFKGTNKIITEDEDYKKIREIINFQIFYVIRLKK